MPVQGRGRYPKAPNTFRDDGTSKGPLAGRVAIDEYRALKMARGDEALKLLHSVGLAVKPIMIKHNWREYLSFPFFLSQFDIEAKGLW